MLPHSAIVKRIFTRTDSQPDIEDSKHVNRLGRWLLESQSAPAERRGDIRL